MAVRRPEAEAGFTLIELLAALVVFAFLVAGLAEGVRFGLSAWRLQTAIIGRDSDLDACSRVLSELLTAIEPAGSADAASLIGTAGELVFTTTLPVRIGDPATNLADARLIEKNGELRLALVPHLHAARLGPAPAPLRTVLATGLDHVTFSYWQPADHAWLATWSATTLPGLIRITFAFKDSRRHWPPVVAAPTLVRYDQ